MKKALFSWMNNFFQKKPVYKTIGAKVKKLSDLEYEIDVRGQTCPGYLLSINNEVDKLAKGLRVYLLVSYLPCEDDIKSWSFEKSHEYVSSTVDGGNFCIQIIV